jgi:hypothetical protein
MRLGGTWITERNLIAGVMRNLRGPAGNTYGRPRWAIVTDVFALGSTSAQALCREFDLDPDEMLIHPDIDDDAGEDLDE